MITALGLVSLLAVVMLGFPALPIGRGLRRWLVQAPAVALNRVRPGHLAFYGMLGLLGIGLAVLFEAEGVRLFGFLLPDTLVWFTMFDVGVFIDSLLIGSAILASNGLRVARVQVATVMTRLAAVRVVLRRGGSRMTPRRPIRKAEIADDGEPETAQPYRAFSMA